MQNKLDMSDRKISVTDSAYYTNGQVPQTPLDPENEPEFLGVPPVTPRERVNSWQFQSTGPEQPKYPALDNVDVRKATFEKLWPKQLLPELVEDFCATGFFYDSRSDFTRCYMCNILVCDWREIHNPADEHWRHQPLCSLTKAPENKLQNKCPTRTVEQKLLQSRMSRHNKYEQLL